MKQAKEKKLIADIENLRRRLNCKIDPEKNAPKHCAQRYALSCQLDKLIYQYMKTIYKD